MKSCFFLGVVAVCILGVYAQEPRRCVSPPEMRTKIVAYDSRKGFNVFANFTYDANNERIRVDESVRKNRTEKGREYFDIITLFRERMEYRRNIATEECVKRTLRDDEKFHLIGVPPDARSRGEAMIGTNAARGIGVKVALWSGTVPELEGARSFTAWTDVDCFPVEEILSFPKSGDLLRESFLDVTLGIPDPDVFNPTWTKNCN